LQAQIAGHNATEKSLTQQLNSLRPFLKETSAPLDQVTDRNHQEVIKNNRLVAQDHGSTAFGLEIKSLLVRFDSLCGGPSIGIH
jgi:hypothetical protein